MNLSAYPAYRDSGVAWLGKVPDGWETLPLRRSVQTVKTGGTPSGAEDSHFEEDGFKWYTPSDFSDDVYLGKSNRSLSESGKKDVRIFPPMTVMMVGIGATIGKVGLATEECSCNQQINAMVCEKKLDPVFATYSLKMMRDFIVKCGKFTTMPIINQDETKNLIITIPPISEQRTIAHFLNVQSAKIDALLVKKRELIDRLKEKRTALISRTVIRGLPPEAARAAGLDPHPPMKASGVDWLGGVPEHWKVRRLKDAGRLVGGSGFPHDEQGVEGEALPFYKVGDLTASSDGRMMLRPPNSISYQTAENLRASIIPPGAIVYAKIGAALLLNRRRITSVNCCIDNNMTAYIPSDKVLTERWAYYWLSILDFGEFMNPGAVPSFSEGYQSTLPLVIPGISEQISIANYLDMESGKLDGMLTKVEEAVERLQEYRTALITAAVTGKIDVRGAAA